MSEEMETVAGQSTPEQQQQWLRLEVLRQAANDAPQGSTSAVIERAQQYVDFVIGGTAPAAGAKSNSGGKSRKNSSSGRKTSTTSEPSPVPEPAATQSSEPTGTASTDAAESTSGVDKETVRKALLGLNDVLQDNNAKAQEIMKTVGGAATIGKIPEEKYQAVYDAAVAAAGAAASDDGLGNGLDD